MPTYVYETIPASENEQPVRFEVRQSMNDKPLERHPETGQPVRRVITGGLGVITSQKGGSTPPPSPCAGGACGCGLYN